jgi:YD repeat-containing protein
VHIASPNVSSLGKVADIPVSYHTGIPTIDIPIYTVSEGPLQLPVSLSYHASGLKVMEQASWVGAGFSLQAGGMITRTIRGVVDEVYTSAPSGTVSYYSNKGYFGYLYTPLVGFSNINNYLKPNNIALDYRSFDVGQKDGEPDLFTFSFNGYSGKFYFRADRSVAIAPQQDLKIIPSYSSSQHLIGLTIITSDGSKYLFGTTVSNSQDVDPVESTATYSSGTGLQNPKSINSWYLYRIQSNDGKYSINLNYVAETYGYYTTSLFPRPSVGGNTNSDCYNLVKNIIYGVRLSSIVFSNGAVNFIPSSSPRQDLTCDSGGLMDCGQSGAYSLGEIQITNSSTLCRSFQFKYGYFTDSHPLTGSLIQYGNENNIHTDTKRLKLLSLTERTCNSVTVGSIAKPPYLFFYYDSTSVPRTLSFAQDHWGFYNGATNNASPIPYLSIDGGATRLTGFSANRDASWPSMRAGTLQKIQYPTGGYTRFVYNHHTATISLNKYDSVNIGTQSATGTATSNGVSFTLTSSTRLKIRSSSSPGSAGNVHIINTSTSQDLGSLAANTVFSLPAGAYIFKVQSTSNTSNAYSRTLWKLNPVYSQPTDITIGGLRIDSLIYNDGLSSSQQIKTYSYVDGNGNSQGILFGQPRYISILRNDRLAAQSGYPDINNNGIFYSSNGCWDIMLGLNPTPVYGYFYSPASIIPMRSLQGSHFGYNQVKVTQSDGGYTVYKYNSYSNPVGDVCIRIADASQCSASIPNYPPAPTPFDFMKEELINVSVYNSSNVLLSEKRYTPVFNYDTIGVSGFIVKSLGGVTFATEYELKSAKKTMVTEESLMYDSNNPTAAPAYGKKDTYFASPNHTLPTKVSVSNAIGGKVLNETHMTYVGDVVIPSCAVKDNYTSTKLALNIATRTGLFNSQRSSCTTDSCRQRRWQQYIYDVNKLRISYVKSRSAYDSAFNKCMTGSAVWNAAGTELKGLVKLKNRYQINPVIESSQWRDGKFLQSSFLNFKDFQNDSISIYPYKIEMIKPPVPELSTYFKPVKNTNSSVTKDSSYAKGQEKTFSYNSGNPVEVTGKDGITTSYIWGYNNNFPIVKAVGVSYATLVAAYNSVGGNLSTLRNQPSLSQALITTYVYDPIIGMTSVTDPNGVTIYYKYDKLGRLSYTTDQYFKVLKNYTYNYTSNIGNH